MQRRKFLSGLGGLVSVATHAATNPTFEARWAAEPNKKKWGEWDRFEVWHGGVNNDIICVKYFGMVIVYDKYSPVRDVLIGQLPNLGFALAMSGDRGDMATTYGFTKDGRCKICFFPIQENWLTYRVMDNEAQFQYGSLRNSTRFRKLRWDGTNWYSSMIWDSWGQPCNLLVPEVPDPVSDTANAPRIIRARA